MPPQDSVFLVVDDFEMMRSVTVSQLRGLGATKIHTAKNGVEALRVLRQDNVDMILSDWNMPVMSGLNLLKTVRADPKLARIPFVMITAEADRARITEAITSGVDGLLVKPYTASGLSSRILKLLSGGASPAPRPAPAPASTLPTPSATTAAPTAKTVQPDDKREADHPHATSILIVDDVAMNQKMLAHQFKDEYVVSLASNGQDALALCCGSNPPDLVLMDVMMPGMDGFEVVSKMRAHPVAASIPVIFVTGRTDDEARLRGMELGAVDFVSKTTDLKVLKPRVLNFLRFVDMRKQQQLDYDAMLDAARLREEAENITRHDLKGSLAGIVGMVQTLADDTSMAQQHVEQLRMVEKTALQVLNMVNLSTELYKMETGRFKLHPEPVDVGDVLRRLAQLLRSAFEDKQITISVDADMPVGREVLLALGDTMLCYSVFQNLIKNACEASPPGGTVAISIKDETPLRIRIENTGAVPKEVRVHFFDKFVTHGKGGGSGLGTYSAQLLTKAQNGSLALAVDDSRNRTMLTVTLPRHHAAVPTGQAKQIKLS